MKEELISFETAKLAKEKGFEFEKITVDTHHDSIQVCTQSLLQRWLREKHKIDVFPYPIQILHNNNEIECLQLTYHYKIIVKGITKFVSLNHEFETHEEAFEIGLQEALKLIP
ncbi:MAG: hypothetical protein WC319_09460 [Candidatus Paceibacterota bacterium]|jgi:hypothetical protein